MTTRKTTPSDVETAVLIRSRRRCCICYGLYGDARKKRGQLAHLDQDPSNCDEDNLAFICMPHHDEYDSTTSQSKGLTRREVVEYRTRLYERLDDLVLVDIQIDRDFDSYTPEEQSQFLRGISLFLKLNGRITIKSKRRGSVILRAEMNSTSAKKIVLAAESGALSKFGVISVQRVRVWRRSKLKDTIIEMFCSAAKLLAAAGKWRSFPVIGALTAIAFPLILVAALCAAAVSSVVVVMLPFSQGMNWGMWTLSACILVSAWTTVYFVFRRR